MSSLKVRSSTPESYYGGYGPAIVGLSWSLFIVATTLLSLRIYTHFAVVKGRGGWALIWACIAWVFAVPSIVFYTMAAAFGIGNHIQVVLLAPNLAYGTLWEWVAAATISFSVGAAKTSVMLYILTIQDRTHKIGRQILWTVVTVNWICYIITVPFIFLQCSPSEKLWQPSLPGACAGIDRAFYWAVFTGAWGAVTDFLLALYPTIIIYKLRIRLTLKLILCFLMGLGCLTAVCSIVKTVEFGRIRETTDATYEIAPLMVLGVTEMWVVLIASSAPPLWPLIHSKIRASQTGHRNNNTSLKIGGLFSRNHYNNRGSQPEVLILGTQSNAFSKLESLGEDQGANSTSEGIRMTQNFAVSREDV